jgi:hypothetical protein
MEELGREGRYSSYLFTTSALDRCEWSASRPGRALHPWKGPPVPIAQEAGWAPDIEDIEVRGKIFCLCRRSNTDDPIVQFVARHCADWATPVPLVTCSLYNSMINGKLSKFAYHDGVLDYEHNLLCITRKLSTQFQNTYGVADSLWLLHFNFVLVNLTGCSHDMQLQGT